MEIYLLCLCVCNLCLVRFEKLSVPENRRPKTGAAARKLTCSLFKQNFLHSAIICIRLIRYTEDTCTQQIFKCIHTTDMVRTVTHKYTLTDTHTHTIHTPTRSYLSLFTFIPYKQLYINRTDYEPFYTFRHDAFGFKKSYSDFYVFVYI